MLAFVAPKNSLAIDPTYVVLLTKLLAERGAHDGTALARASLEVSTAALASGGVEVCWIFVSSKYSINSVWI